MKAIKVIAMLVLCSIVGQLVASPIVCELTLRERISNKIDNRKEGKDFQTVEAPPEVERTSWDAATSYNRGRLAGKQHSSGGWFAGGVASGFLLGLIGTLVITVAAGGGEPPYVPHEADYATYRAGYKDASRSKNRLSALGGGLLGTAIIVGIVVASSSEE